MITGNAATSKQIGHTKSSGTLMEFNGTGCDVPHLSSAGTSSRPHMRRAGSIEFGRFELKFDTKNEKSWITMGHEW